MWTQGAGKKERGALPDNTNLLPPSLKASRSLLRNMKEALKGTTLPLPYRCDRLNTAPWLSSQPKGELLRF